MGLENNLGGCRKATKTFEIIVSALFCVHVCGSDFRSPVRV